MDPGHGGNKVTKTQIKEVSYDHLTKKKKKIDFLFLLLLLFLSFLEALPETEHAAFDSHKNNSH